MFGNKKYKSYINFYNLYIIFFGLPKNKNKNKECNIEMIRIYYFDSEDNSFFKKS